MLFVLLAAAGFGWTGRTWRLVPILTILALVIVIDLCVRLVPDVLTGLGLVYAVALAAAAGSKPLLDAVVGTLIAGGVLLLLALASRGQIGGGDVKLAGLLGALLGWKVALVVVAAAEVVAGIVALAALAALRRRPTRLIPVGAVIALFGAVALIVTS